MAQQSGDKSQQASDSRLENDDSRMPARLNLDSRIIVASNRGPFSYFEDDAGELAVKRDFNSGGEEVGLSPVRYRCLSARCRPLRPRRAASLKASR